jgi:hypothetical protein
MLSTSGEVIFAERSFIPGSGLSGESIQNFPNDTFIDIDVVDSINACRYVALTDSVSHTRVTKKNILNFSGLLDNAGTAVRLGGEFFSYRSYYLWR